MKWRIPVLWPGETVTVLASGPSLTPRAAEVAVRSGPTIVINNTFELAPEASLLYAADVEWWALRRPAGRPDPASFAGLRVSVAHATGVLTLENAGVVGYSDARDRIHTYGYSGAQGIQIAAKAGAKRILLLGFDMRGGHWHAEHQAPLRTTEPHTYAKWIERTRTLAVELEKRGVEVLNCAPGSALDCFPFAEFEEALAR